MELLGALTTADPCDGLCNYQSPVWLSQHNCSCRDVPQVGGKSNQTGAGPWPARHQQLPLHPVVPGAPTSCQSTHQQQVPLPLERVVAWHTCKAAAAPHGPTPQDAMCEARSVPVEAKQTSNYKICLNQGAGLCSKLATPNSSP